MQESEPKKRRKPLIYIRLTNVQEHLYPHKGAFFPRLLFLSPVRRRGGLVITILQRLRTIPRTGSGKQFAANPREHERERSRKNGSSEGRPKKNGMDALWQQTFYTIGRCCKLFIIRIKFLSLYIIFEQPDHHGNPKRGRIRERLDKNIDRQ